MSRSRLRPALLALAVCAGPLACSESAREQLREHTYPPSFNYVPEDRLRSAMWDLAYHVAELDRRMRDPALGGEALQLQVIHELTEMQRAAGALGPGEWPSNHPQVSRNIDAFRDDLADALRTASVQPPRRFVAMTLGLGLHSENLVPATAGTDYQPSAYLKQLQDLRRHFTVFSGVSHPQVSGGHRAEASLLTARPMSASAQSRNTISLDQLMAKHLGNHTRFPSLRVQFNH